jgi:hypothetical protein
MIDAVKPLIERHAELELLYGRAENNDETIDIDLNAIGQEQDEIVEAVFAIVRDNLGGLETVRKALERIDQIIEFTYAHDDDGERIEDESSEHSAADIVEMLTDTENVVSDALNALN